jgi:hypothetical protein
LFISLTTIATKRHHSSVAGELKKRNPGEAAQLILTFLERHRKEGLMSRCGTRDREATVVMDAAGRRRRRRNRAARKEGFPVWRNSCISFSEEEQKEGCYV